jgi:hypothetical protein
MTATPTARVFTAVAGHGPAATELTTKALHFASQLLDGRLRHNGDPRITHTREAATVADLDADIDTVVAALLLDRTPRDLHPVHRPRRVANSVLPTHRTGQGNRDYAAAHRVRSDPPRHSWDMGVSPSARRQLTGSGPTHPARRSGRRRSPRPTATPFSTHRSEEWMT